MDRVLPELTRKFCLKSNRTRHNSKRNQSEREIFKPEPDPNPKCKKINSYFNVIIESILELCLIINFISFVEKLYCMYVYTHCYSIIQVFFFEKYLGHSFKNHQKPTQKNQNSSRTQNI